MWNGLGETTHWQLVPAISPMGQFAKSIPHGTADISQLTFQNQTTTRLLNIVRFVRFRICSRQYSCRRSRSTADVVLGKLEVDLMRFALTVLCVYAMTATSFLAAGQARPQRSITDGVYSAPQATRGQQLYKAQCAECHGNSLEGTIGSPLVGDSFLSNWSARSLTNFVDKIQKTMPFNSPGSLSRPE